MSREETAEAFKNVQSQIGYCGIWCGSCIVGNRLLTELTRRFDKLLKGYGLEKWASPLIIRRLRSRLNSCR